MTTTLSQNLPFLVDLTNFQRAYGRAIDWASVPDSFRSSAQTIVVGTGGAVATDTALPVDALPVALPIGTILTFGAGKFAKLTAAAAAGATELTVEALVADIDEDDEATYGGSGEKQIPAGTIMATLASGKVIPRSAVTGAETATGLLTSAATENDLANSAYGLVVGGAIYANLLPDYANASFGDWQGELETAGVGVGWMWETYADNTA